MFVVGELVKVTGKDFDSGIIERINLKTIELWCDKGRGIKVNKKNVKKYGKS